jgi:hypothetical protein
MTPTERAAAAWAARLLEALLALTGCEVKPESRDKLATLRAMANESKPVEPVDYGSPFAVRSDRK